MEKRKLSKSSKKPIKALTTSKKLACKTCKNKLNNALIMAHSLYRKYSFVQNHYYLQQFNSITDKLSQSNSTNDTEE